jgi:DNA-binding NarL/FixJ family response regulator
VPVTRSGPLTVALVDDYDVVLSGLANMLKPYGDRVRIVELDADEPVDDDVDIVLYDSFAQPESDHEENSVLVANSRARRVVVYTCNFHSELVDAASELGVDGYLAKTLPAGELVTATEGSCRRDRRQPATTGASSTAIWPGLARPKRRATERESEILALITRGKSNGEVAELTYLKPNTVKSYIRSTYRKIGGTSRTQAVLWGVRHGFVPDHDRLQPWQTNR